MGTCRVCKREADERRGGVCWDCATDGERRALQRSILQHLLSAVANVPRRQWFGVRCDVTWAWQRLTRTGYYKPGGICEREYGIRV